MNKFSEKGNQAGSPFNAKDQFAKGVIYGDFYTVDKPQPWAKAVAIIGKLFFEIDLQLGIDLPPSPAYDRSISS